MNRGAPDSGANRSEMQRFLQVIHDGNGVTACNKAGAVVHAQGLPLLGSGDICDGGLCGLASPFGECQVFKIDNLAAFFVDSMVGAANLYFRADILRNGILGIGSASVSTIEQSSGIGYDPSNADAYNGPDVTKPGFWDLATSATFRPKPAFLNRLVFFDVVNDSPTASGKTYLTNHFLVDLDGATFGSSTCPERVIPDPCNGDSSCGDAADADVASDGMVHGLRACAANEWLYQRDGDATFVWEDYGFLQALTPLVTAFTTAPNPTTGQPRRREDLLIELFEVMNKHWQSAQGTADECLEGTSPPAQCAKDGADTYEPLLSLILSSDMVPAVHDFLTTIEGIGIPTCATMDPATHLCTAAGPALNGISVVANATRALLDPTRAHAAGLKDRQGTVTSLRNDGSTNPQVTPLYLILESLNEIDQAFAQYAQANPQDTQRQAQWRSARSQLVDQFLGVSGQNTPMQSFTDPTLPRILPIVLDSVRTQAVAHCGGTASCTWASDFAQSAGASMGGPMMATTMDLMDGIRQNGAARAALEQLLSYLLAATSSNDSLQEFLGSVDDILQVMSDDANLVPLYHVLATAASPTTTDAQGQTQRGVLDSTTALLSRIAGRAYDAKNNEICAKELDPDAVLDVALADLVTPMKGTNGSLSETPLEVIMDVIADVNRSSPGATTKLNGDDYQNMANEMSEFLLDGQRGLEQFYAIVRNGTEN